MSKAQTIESIEVWCGTVELAIGHFAPGEPQDGMHVGTGAVWVRVVSEFDGDTFPTRWFRSSQKSYHKTREAVKAKGGGVPSWLQRDAWRAEAEHLRWLMRAEA